MDEEYLKIRFWFGFAKPIANHPITSKLLFTNKTAAVPHIHYIANYEISLVHVVAYKLKNKKLNIRLNRVLDHDLEFQWWSSIMHYASGIKNKKKMRRFLLSTKERKKTKKQFISINVFTAFNLKPWLNINFKRLFYPCQHSLSSLNPNLPKWIFVLCDDVMYRIFSAFIELYRPITKASIRSNGMIQHAKYFVHHFLIHFRKNYDWLLRQNILSICQFPIILIIIFLILFVCCSLLLTICALSCSK